MSNKVQTFSEGDSVSYSAKFLRSIGDFTHSSGSQVGKVLEINSYSGMKFPVLKIKWDNGEEGGGLACNFVLSNKKHLEPV